jgi:lipoprotein-anchoring transpeptidase ErfK/SrfK
MKDGWEIVPVILFDPSAARAGLEKLSEEASQPPTDASFYVQDGRLVPVPGQIGYTFNIDETLQRIHANPRAVLEDGLIAVSLKPVPPRIEDVSPAMAEAQRLLDTPVSLKAYDPITNETLDLPVSKENIGSWLRVEPGENMPVVTINEGSVTHTIAQMSEALGPDRWIDAPAVGPSFAQAFRDGSTYTALVRHNPTTYTIESGDTLLKIGWKVGMPFWMIQEANPGLDPENMWAGQQLTIPSKDELLPLPVVMNKRIVISISEQRLWAYQDGQQVARHVISTGIDRSPTQPGVFQVQTHDPNAYASVWDLHMPDFLGIYEAWPGFMNGIHGLPTLSNGRRLWANILGRPASYGCIILDLDSAEWLFSWAEDGVVVGQDSQQSLGI